MADLIAAFVTGLMDALRSEQSRGKRILIAVGVFLLGAVLLTALMGGCGYSSGEAAERCHGLRSYPRDVL
ncbi:hypothetical protein SDC9_205343 [bioreactor metagenome]|uniref:Uncharacterized protein n=1 Tax=bioreactor metagenome TaxID=1076179 RepID=A0A645J4M8_9ZZZZ